MQLLAGPYTIARVGADNRSAAPAERYAVFWDDDLGLGSVGAYTSGTDIFGHGPNYCIVQLDGTAGARGKVSRGSIMIDVSGQYEYAWFATYFDGVLGAVGDVRGFDKRTGISEDKPIAKSASIVAGANSYPQIRTANRLIHVAGPFVTKRAVNGSDTAWVTEYTLTPSSVLDPLYVGGPPSVSRTKDPGVICLIYPSGGVLFYDVTAQTQVFPETWTPWIGVNDMAWFSVRLNIYISFLYTNLGADGTLTVWANSVRPDTIAAPVAVTALGLGKVSQVKTRVLGTKSEPCRNELIAWSILSGNGALSATQSATDKDGYAYINYIATLVSGSNPAIQASLEF